MITFVFKVFIIILLLLQTITAYNKRKCDDEPCGTGPCRAIFHKWRFIKYIGVCEPFIYGGCKGTRNIFETEEECMKQCMNAKK